MAKLMTLLYTCPILGLYQFDIDSNFRKMLKNILEEINSIIKNTLHTHYENMLNT